MATKKVIAIAGATGAQGGGLARAILADAQSEFSVRALTRDTSSAAARQLADAGAEVVQADVADLQSLVRAFEGTHGAFCVTFFWAHFSPEREMAEARNLAHAAHQARVRHAIWSTLEDTRQWMTLADARMPTLMERYKVPHFDVKGEADNIFREMAVPTTFLRTSFYWDNFVTFGMGPVRGADGKPAITFPMGDAPLPGIAAEDIGRCAYGVFQRRAELIGKTIGIAGGQLTGQQMAASLTRAFGEEVRYNDVDPAVYRSFGFPGADELGNMFQFKRDFAADYCGARSVELSRELNPRLQSFDDWVDANRNRLVQQSKGAGA
jgi:uncharacterized protein YbjT (DUF2867 family)